MHKMEHRMSKVRLQEMEAERLTQLAEERIEAQREAKQKKEASQASTPCHVPHTSHTCRTRSTRTAALSQPTLTHSPALRHAASLCFPSRVYATLSQARIKAMHDKLRTDAKHHQAVRMANSTRHRRMAKLAAKGSPPSPEVAI